MIIRFDKNLNISATEEESIIAGNNKVNEIKIFMYDKFDFAPNKAYLNFELNDGKQFNNISTTKQYKLNEYNVEEECFYYVLPKFLLKEAGRLSLTVRISPLDEISQIENSSLITTQIFFAVFENGEEIIDPETAELLRQEIANVEVSTQTSAREYVDELASKGYFKGDKGDKGDRGEKGEKGEPGNTITKISELINDGDGKSPYATKANVSQELSNLINSAPQTLDTLGEIAKAIEENEDVIEALNKSIGDKADRTEITNVLRYKGETTLDNYGSLLDWVGDICAITGTNYYMLCVESTLTNGHVNKKFYKVLRDVDLSGLMSVEPFNDLVDNKTKISNSYGGASIGENSSAGAGFAGGKNAHTTVTVDTGGTIIYDAIQLGTGTNNHNKTLQVYGDNIYDANTHTGKFQNISLNGEDLRDILNNTSGKITVDSSLSVTSKNPIENQAVTNALNKKLNKSDYVVETLLGSTSGNPIATKTVFNALTSKADINETAYNCEVFIDDNNNLWLTLNNYLGNVVGEDFVNLSTKFATKEFVNSSVSTATATFRGTYNSVDKLPTTDVDINDYAFISDVDDFGNKIFKKYKYTDKWEYEYTLNNSSFTQEQWNSINSGITEALTAQISTNLGDISDLKIDKVNTSDLSTVAKTGSYSDLSGKPVLGGASSKEVTTEIIDSSNLPTSSAVIKFVEGKGYITSSALTPYAKIEGLGNLAFADELNKNDVGLGNVDNTSDVNKPISNATQNALDLKENKSNLKALAYKDSLNKSDVGLGNVDNTSDVNKPISTATQNALDLKANLTDITNFITKDVNNLTNYTVSTGVGTTIDLSVDTTNYKITAQLKNSSGTVLSSDEVDLPLESVVVNASYDKTNKKITLTLQNGTTTSFSVADLVSGLATESALGETNVALSNLTTRVYTNEIHIGEVTEKANANYNNIANIIDNDTKIANNFGGGSIGSGSAASVGFAGGKDATTSAGGGYVDAIQLGTGNNGTGKTLQVYDDNIYDARTHTGTFQKISLNGNDLQTILNNKQAKLTIDESLSSTSTNLVQNKAVTNALNNKLNKSDYVVETSLNNASNNPIATKAVFTSLETKPARYEVVKSGEMWMDADGYLWLVLSNNLGESLSTLYVDLSSKFPDEELTEQEIDAMFTD